MAHTQISSGSPFEEIMGYSRAIVAGNMVYVAGTSGFANGQIADDVVEQTETAFKTIAEALAKAGSSLDDAVRVVVYLTDVAYFEKVAPVLGKHLKKSKPANSTVIVAALVDPRMKVEVEITAIKQG
jgi:enamine deaminase RidA (YjgF/YER057c/UK114 family)